ncbi:hypothetical protein HQ585_21290 [candidate division KSB1 bacterium]|nr:hypothetical protein [candidate division KSB1 bacterium]
MSHISDSQFQELLDDNLNERQSKLFLRHIWDCPQCREEWQIYRQLKKTLMQEPVVPLSNHFTDDTMASLPSRLPRFIIQRWIIAVSSLSILAGIGALYYFRDILKRIVLTNAGFESPLLQLTSILSTIGNFILRIGGDQVVLFLIACFALLLIGLLDKKVFQRRTKHSFQVINGTL